MDGTRISIPDTPENQAVHPQPSAQACGVGFPMARLVVAICLATGAALDMAVGPHSGKAQANSAWCTACWGTSRRVMQCLPMNNRVAVRLNHCATRLNRARPRTASVL